MSITRYATVPFASLALGLTVTVAPTVAQSIHILVPADQVQWAPAPPVLPAGAQISVLEGNPSEKGPVTMRLKFPADYSIVAHWHSMTERLTVLYNAMIDKRPALIVYCADVADVIATVDYARTNDLLTAIRGGGHNGGGLGTCDDGLVIDLSRMKGIRVDPAARTVSVQTGCTGGDMDHATHAFGMATPGGTVSTTGVAGLTLGGGIGI